MVLTHDLQVYRHLLFNRLGQPDGEKTNKLDPSILRLGTLLILFDVYLTWARIEKAGSSNAQTTSNAENFLTNAPIITQYLFFLTLNVLATVAQHLTIRLLVRLLFSRRQLHHSAATSPSPPPPLSGSPEKDPCSNSHSPRETSSSSRAEPAIDPRLNGRAVPTASAISTAILVSSCTKLFPILLVIWPTQSLSASDESEFQSLGPTFASRARSYVGYAVLLNNIEALLILLDCGYVVATGLAVAGWVARWLVEGIGLGMVGLEGDAGPVGDLVSFVGGLGKWTLGGGVG
jgi:lipid intermediate transporter